MARLLDRRRPCRDCGFDGTAVTPDDAAVAVRSFARRWTRTGTRIGGPVTALEDAWELEAA